MVSSLTFKIEEATYIQGVIAVGMTKTGVIGAIGGIELPSIKLTFAGIRRGFLASRPQGRLLVSFTGSFDDVGAAKEAALAQVSAGADLLFHNADAAGLGVFHAAVQSHIYAFGTNGDQNAVAPENILASAVTHIPKAFVRIATEIKSGEFRGGMLEYGMKEGMVEVVYNPRLQSKISAATLEMAKKPSNKSSGGKSFLVSGSECSNVRPSGEKGWCSAVQGGHHRRCQCDWLAQRFLAKGPSRPNFCRGHA